MNNQTEHDNHLPVYNISSLLYKKCRTCLRLYEDILFYIN